MRLSRRALGILWFAPSLFVPAIIVLLAYLHFDAGKSGAPFGAIIVGLFIYSVVVAVVQIRNDGVKAPVAWLLEIGLTVLIFTSNAIVIGVAFGLWNMRMGRD